MILSTKLTLNQAIAESPNLASRFTPEDLVVIGDRVWEGYVADLDSRSDWEKRMAAAMDLALQVPHPKSFPWPNCANVQFPLVTIAALQFHSRAYPTLVSGPEVVKARVVGEDPDGSQKARALRVSCHMSYQVLEEDASWEEQHDRLLFVLPIIGVAFKKTYRNAEKGHNVSELVMARDLVMDYYAKSVDNCARKTHVIPLYRNEMVAKMRRGVFMNYEDEPWFQANAIPHTPLSAAQADRRKGETPPEGDEATPFSSLEQHCLFDFDQDGFYEPYIVTIEAETHKVLRIVARWARHDDVTYSGSKVSAIRAEEYFTKYGLVPAPDGSIYDIGFGALLGPLNESVNTLINQLIDAGTMATTAGGFLGRGAKIRGGTYSFAPNEWKRVDVTGEDLNKSIVPLQVREPSAVLFQLLSLLINYTERISGSTDMMVGENPGQNTPAETSRAMIEQGMKIYTAAFKRVWRCMKEEFKKLYILNAYYLPPESTYGPQAYKALRQDYLGDPGRVVPAADPNTISESAKVQLAITVKQAAATTPGYDTDEVERNLLRAMRVDGVDVLFPGSEKRPPGKSEKVTLQEMKNAMEGAKLQAEQMRFIAQLTEDRRVNDAAIAKIVADIEIARATVAGDEGDRLVGMLNAVLAMHKAHQDNLNGQLDALLKSHDQAIKAQEVAQQPQLEQIKADAVVQAAKAKPAGASK